MLLEHLKQAERHAAAGERVLKHQLSVIEHLRRDHHSGAVIEEAEKLLRSFEEVQSMHLADIDRLRAQLATPTGKRPLP